jgi:hypothetical protein
MKRTFLIEKYKQILNNVIEKLSQTDNNKKPVGRPNKFDNNFYLKYIFRILFYGEFWNTFECNLCDRSTIRKKFYLWEKMGVFEIAYNLLNEHYNKNRTFKHLFIDSTIIQNMNCSNICMDYYHKIKSKKQLKISVICDSNKIPLIQKITNPHEHDLTVCKKLVKDLDLHLKKKSKLIGDKGYISKNILLKTKNKNIKLIFNYRKNQKKINSTEDIKLLKKRTIIENLFARLKNSYKRIRFIYDRKLTSYITFLKMAFTCEIIRFLDK